MERAHQQSGRGTSVTTTEHELLTITEVAELMRTPVATLRYWRHCGIGPKGIRVGRRVLYRALDVRAWIDDQAR